MAVLTTSDIDELVQTLQTNQRVLDAYRKQLDLACEMIALLKEHVRILEAENEARKQVSFN